MESKAGRLTTGCGSKIVLLLLVLYISAGNLYSQGKGSDLTTKSRKAANAYWKAADQVSARNLPEAEFLLRKAVEDDPGFIEAWLLLGDVTADQKKPLEAIEAYKKGISIDPEFFPNVLYLVANLEVASGKYQDAKDHYRKYLNHRQIPAGKLKLIDRQLQNIEFAIDAMAHPVPFEPVNLGDSINTKYDEYVNAITADDQVLYLTVRKPLPDSKVEKEDFYKSYRLPSGEWGKVAALGPPLNTVENEGAMCISPDGMDMYYAHCSSIPGEGGCDIYHSTRLGASWSPPVNIGKPVNTDRWESQPSISADGRTLYFASARSGGKGSSDIWKSVLQDDGSWSIPENLGDSINTSESEYCPCIHPDGKTLYFASKGHVGMGGFDLFYSRLDENGKWSKAVNLGYPINTYSDEINLIVNARGDIAYFSSDKLNGKGREDIYSFKLYEKARPMAVNYMKGIVFNSITRQPLNATFELIDLSTGKTVVKSHAEPVRGEFLVTLPTGHEYALNVSHDGYLFYSENFDFKGEHKADDPYLKNIPLQPIKKGEIVVLNNIFFETDKTDLKEESLAELGKLVGFIKKNPSLKIEISGHTDNVGADKYNQSLSENRAKVVYNYLIEKGISGERLSYAGYGKTKPVATNETAEGRKKNRRTEFKVIDY